MLALINKKDEILSIYEKNYLSKVYALGKTALYLIYINKYFQIKKKT